MIKIFYSTLLILLCINVNAQNKVMDEGVYDIWNSIKDIQISSNGEWVSYNVNPFKGDKNLKLYNTRNRKTITFPRADKAKLDYDNQFICFAIHAFEDSIINLKRKKVEKEEFPKDSLGFFDFAMNKTIKIPRVSVFKIPEKKGGLLAYSYESENKTEQDSTAEEAPKLLIIKNLVKLSEDTIVGVNDFYWTENGEYLAAYCTEKDSIDTNSVIIYDGESGKVNTIWSSESKAEKLSWSKDGSHLSFLSFPDSTDASEYDISLMHWTKNSSYAKRVLDNTYDFLEEHWHVSKNMQPTFSKDSRYLFFGTAPELIEQDTNLLEEEIVNVEVWTYTDDILHTEQNAKLKDQKEKSFIQAFDLVNKRLVKVADADMPDYSMPNEESNHILLTNYQKYRKSFSWEGLGYKDASIVNLESGKSTKFATKEDGTFRMSPYGNFAYWYCRPDTSWKAYDIRKDKVNVLTNPNMGRFSDELNDRPMLPSSYNIAGWIEGDKSIIINDRYDLWMIDPGKETKGKKLTNGRETKVRYRYVDLDKENNWIKEDGKILLHHFSESDKSSGYSWLDLKTGALEMVINEDYSFSSRVYKAENASDIVYSKESFIVYPDLIHNTLGFETSFKFSNVNPQQTEYRWGKAELIEWKDKRGISHQGMLFKPDGFDPKKTYPLLVNFYEKSSNGLHRHRSPYAHRSTINYSFYINRGYVIFNPDVHYTIGYPGESCYNSVMSGIDKVLSEGYIDENRVGVQGHSWGGYQVAHLITKTDRFKCAESGAPVVNMYSAYGGIRWRTGLSRMFQYEKTQSRIGATIWEDPNLYWENSPLFNLDKVNTPVLIMHNDKDGAVPWYQGIEFFVAMRRLNKPAWMLNYNDEPHWPVKRQNRLDFNKRMQQFFDHYLLGAPMPKWMKSGVPAIEKGINQGFEVDK